MLRDENATWYAMQFLVKFLKYALKLNREQILELINKYTGWSDYNPRITAFYVNKHFRNGTCENKCSDCVYGSFKQQPYIIAIRYRES